MQVLITAGGTSEPIDGVRYITNFSTGSTGAFISDYLQERGFDITLLTSTRGVRPRGNSRVITYTTYTDIKDALNRELKTGRYKAVIQMAAISDFSVDYLESNGKRLDIDENGKLDSGNNLKIVLKKNPKLVNRLKGLTERSLTVIAFKLTNNGEPEVIKAKIDSIFKGGEVDFIVHNDLTSISEDSHKTTIYSIEDKLLEGATKADLGENLKKILLGEI